jgi:hypothetical protein
VSAWLPDHEVAWGGRPVARTAAQAVPRCRAVLTGRVRAVRVRRPPPGPAGSPGPLEPAASPGPALEAELDDGTGVVTLRWLGRDGVAGIAAGAHLTAEGTVLADRGRHVLLNPLYRLGHSSTSW